MTAHIEPITVTVDSLLRELRTTYAEAVSGLNVERVNLENESQGILKAADELKLLLPAKAREAERAADALLLAGKHEAAQAKRDEQQQAEAAPAEPPPTIITLDSPSSTTGTNRMAFMTSFRWSGRRAGASHTPTRRWRL